MGGGIGCRTMIQGHRAAGPFVIARTCYFLVMFIRNNLNFYRASGQWSLNLIYSIARWQHDDKIVAPHCCLVATPPTRPIPRCQGQAMIAEGCEMI